MEAGGTVHRKAGSVGGARRTVSECQTREEIQGGAECCLRHTPALLLLWAEGGAAAESPEVSTPSGNRTQAVAS
ncbi:hypothetical protein O3P69_008705 [Scylla paramamosain]|uniref:Uncharacterized protein n=1 Tax=Scylla paramamosain TaxID=85552 RepID=A0AAW0SLE0_SCYPA